MAIINEAAMQSFVPIKPGIPKPAWVDESSSVEEVKAAFQGEFEYTEQGEALSLVGLHAKGFYIQFISNEQYTGDNTIEVLYVDEHILNAYINLDEYNKYSTAEMFIRNGMWIFENTEPVSLTYELGAVKSLFSRALVDDYPYITDIILGTSGASSGTYKVWTYE